MSTSVMMVRPSDFPRDERFRDPSTPPFRDECGQYHVFSYTDVTTVLRNADHAFSQDYSLWLPDDHHMLFDFMWAIESFTHDGRPGRHDVLRGLVEPWFRHQAVSTMEPVIRRLARELVTEVIEKGTGKVDIADELAYSLPVRVICRLVGMELDREEWLRGKMHEAEVAEWDEVPRQWDVEAYHWQLVAKRLLHPRDELMDVLIGAWKDHTITDRELIGYLLGLVQAGTESTGTSLVNAFALLAEFDLLDDVRDRLDDREAMRRVVEEILRFGTPFPAFQNYVLKESSFGDLTVPSGSILNVWLAAANRDEAVNGGVVQSDPAVFDPDRWPNRHIGLGKGPHYCLGAELARLETWVLLQEALPRLPGLHLDQTKPFTRLAGLDDIVTQAHFRFDQDQAEQSPCASDLSDSDRSDADS